MKLLVKSSFTIFLMLLLVNICYAQKKNRAPYSAIVHLEGKQRIHGKITAINDTALVLADKNDIIHPIAYQKILSLKVFKRHGDVGYALVTGALAAGAIVAAQSIDDSAAATIVGVGGTIAVVGLSMTLHNVFHGAEVKIKASKEKINAATMSQKLSKYIVNDVATKP